MPINTARLVARRDALRVEGLSIADTAAAEDRRLTNREENRVAELISEIRALEDRLGGIEEAPSSAPKQADATYREILAQPVTPRSVRIRWRTRALHWMRSSRRSPLVPRAGSWPARKSTVPHSRPPPMVHRGRGAPTFSLVPGFCMWLDAYRNSRSMRSAPNCRL